MRLTMHDLPPELMTADDVQMMTATKPTGEEDPHGPTEERAEGVQDEEETA